MRLWWNLFLVGRAHPWLEFLAIFHKLASLIIVFNPFKYGTLEAVSIIPHTKVIQYIIVIKEFWGHHT